jgi:hypothetical protein
LIAQPRFPSCVPLDRVQPWVPTKPVDAEGAVVRATDIQKPPAPRLGAGTDFTIMVSLSKALFHRFGDIFLSRSARLWINVALIVSFGWFIPATADAASPEDFAFTHCLADKLRDGDMAYISKDGGQSAMILANQCPAEMNKWVAACIAAGNGDADNCTLKAVIVAQSTILLVEAGFPNPAPSKQDATVTRVPAYDDPTGCPTLDALKRLKASPGPAALGRLSHDAWARGFGCAPAAGHNDDDWVQEAETEGGQFLKMRPPGGPPNFFSSDAFGSPKTLKNENR